ncbi:MAG: hypothetical protein V2I36_07120 [Desulfopila sp.]|nr:hypothetical protein [Desulfopila sp.]
MSDFIGSGSIEDICCETFIPDGEGGAEEVKAVFCRNRSRHKLGVALQACGCLGSPVLLVGMVGFHYI